MDKDLSYLNGVINQLQLQANASQQVPPPTQQSGGKKKKKILVKKKKGSTISPAEILAQAKAQNENSNKQQVTQTKKEPASKTIPQFALPNPFDLAATMAQNTGTDFNLDPSLFNLMNIPAMASQTVQKTMQSVPAEKLENMSFEEITKLVTTQMTTNFPPPPPATDNNNNSSTAAPMKPFDMSKIMTTLMQNAEKMVANPELDPTQGSSTTKSQAQKDPNAFPSVFDTPPEKPEEKSGKYSNTEDEKKQHLIYKGFNVTLLSLLTMLTEKLPHKTNHYALLRKMIESTIEVNPCKPRDIWKDSVKGREEKLQKYTPENVDYICKNLNTIELLNLLELETEWDRFTTEDFKTFYAKLNQLQNISDMIESIPTDMMTAIQDMTLRVNDNNTIQVDENGNPTNMGELFQILSGEVFKDGKIFKGMQQMSANLVQTMTENQMPQPPGYSKILDKANNDV